MSRQKCGDGVSPLSCFQTVVGEWGPENIFKEREGAGEKSQPDSAGEGALGHVPMRPPSGTEGGTEGGTRTQLVSEASREGS